MIHNDYVLAITDKGPIRALFDRYSDDDKLMCEVLAIVTSLPKMRFGEMFIRPALVVPVWAVIPEYSAGAPGSEENESERMRWITAWHFGDGYEDMLKKLTDDNKPKSIPE